MVILIKIYQYRDYANVDEEDRSNIFLISFHYLLYVAESIKDFGSCRGYWQFPMERVCGMLIPLVKSQKHSYASLWNNILLNKRFNHLKYKTEFYDQIFPQNKEKEWPSHQVFSFSLYNDKYEFYSLSKKYVLLSAELKKLKETYAIIFDININIIEVKRFVYIIFNNYYNF